MSYKLVALALSVAAAGCGTGSNEASGPVRLVRIMVQDAHPSGVRGVAMDLLDAPGTPYSTAARCDASTPCAMPYLLQQVAPDFSCTPAGTCNDPLAAGLAPLTPPETHRSGEAGGTQLRLVFDKLLQATTTLTDAVEVDDAGGAKVAGSVYWDPSGSPAVSSDLILIPFGPALVWKPDAPLHAGAQYMIKVDASLVTDRSGNPMADQSGTVVSGSYTKTFMTEGLILLPATTVTNVTAAGAVTVTPDEILQLSFNAPAAGTTACTAANGGVPLSVETFAEAGADATRCASADATLLDIVAVDALGAPTDWAPGTYTLSCEVAAAGGGGSTTVAGGFTVAGSAKASDPQSRTQHVVCP